MIWQFLKYLLVKVHFMVNTSTFFLLFTVAVFDGNCFSYLAIFRVFFYIICIKRCGYILAKFVNKPLDH